MFPVAERFYGLFFQTKGKKKKLTVFFLAAVFTMSRVSVSGFNAYFFITAASENSLIGIKAEKLQTQTRVKQQRDHL